MKQTIQIPIEQLLDQYPQATDRTLISESCWSNMPLNRRIWNYGRMITRGGYEINPLDVEGYQQLIKSFENNRDVVIFGRPGSGKTTITRILSKVTYHIDHPNRFKFANALAITEEFSKHGHGVLSKYSQGCWVIDDVGAEEKIQINGFGTSYNVFELLLYKLCENSSRGLARFYISTNLNVDDIENKYGSRVASRLGQYVDYIKLNGNDYRKSKKIVHVYPEVIHKPKEEAMTDEERANCKRYAQTIREHLSQMAAKFTQSQASEKRDPDKLLKPTTFEQSCWDFFDHQWEKQGRKHTHGLTGQAIIEHDSEMYTRESFTKMVMETVKTQNEELKTQNEDEGTNDN